MSKELLRCPIDEQAQGNELLEQVIDYYHNHLQEHEPAIAYLKKQGVYNESIIQQFKLGFADRNLGIRLPSKRIAAGKRIRTNLTEAGIYRSTGHAHFNGCITVPIHNEDGTMAQIYGRRIDARSPKISKDLLLHEQPAIFNLGVLPKREIILCDSMLDGLSWLASGYVNPIVLLDLEVSDSSFTDKLLAHKVEKVHLSFPATDAGEQATAAATEALRELGIEVYHTRLPWSLTVNDYLCKQGSLEQLYLDAEWKSGAANPTSGSEEARSTQAINEGEYYTLTLGNCVYRVGGLHKNNSLEVMRITLRLTVDSLIHIDTVDLYKDKDRKRFTDRASEETFIDKALIKRHLGQLLIDLETIQEKRLYASAVEENNIPSMSTEQQEEALAFLKDTKLIDNVLTNLNNIGLIGETTNKLTTYLALLSRKLHKPLALAIQSTSASGKSTLMDTVLSFFPPEEQLNYSAITGQSLFYQNDLKHKILAISEELGFEKAGGSLKLLQSQGYLTISSTSKDPKTGRMMSMDYHVEGPIALIFTTTAINLDEELMNRCICLSINESTELTQQIHSQQRQAHTLEGLLAVENKHDIQALMQNAQRLIKPYHVVNPYAPQLTFSSSKSRTRRDHEKYLTLIDSIALLRQYQKPIQQVTKANGDILEIIEVELCDIEQANALAPEIFGRTLDELAPQTRNLLQAIQQLVKDKKQKAQEPSYTRKELRQLTGWSEYQVRTHVQKLEAMEYILKLRGSQGSLCKYYLIAEASSTAHDIGICSTSQLKAPKRAPVDDSKRIQVIPTE